MLEDDLNKRNILLGAKYLSSLSLLILNDLVLKTAFPGFLSGKLSDLAGIYCFSLFLFSLFPKLSWLIVSGVTIFFTYWKTELSSGLMDFFSKNGIPFTRTIDYSDLFCLAVLPLALFDFKNSNYKNRVPNYKFLLCCITSFIAFSASQYNPGPRDEGYYLMRVKTWDPNGQWHFTPEEHTYFIQGISKKEYLQLVKAKNFGVIEHPDGKGVTVYRSGDEKDNSRRTCKIDLSKNINDTHPYVDLVIFSEIREEVKGSALKVFQIIICMPEIVKYGDEDVKSLLKDFIEINKHTKNF